ncbi:PAS-domain containing protein [Shimia sp. SDUM112013]|uniref:PAS-domain containing protein n=1 Tax=Shimia sp. SDUM112013 TaxID=3136160 RepID=UPI0032EBD050
MSNFDTGFLVAPNAFLVIGLFVSFSAGVALSKLFSRRAPSAVAREQAVFIFEDGLLATTNKLGSEILASLEATRPDWQGLAPILSRKFSEVPPTLGIADSHSLKKCPPLSDKFASLTIEQWGNRARIILEAPNRIQSQLSERMNQEGNQAVYFAPYPIWNTGSDGALCWANAAYDNLVHTMDKDDAPASLFNSIKTAAQSETQRVALTTPDQTQTLWYDISSLETDNGVTYFAIDANAVVNAEIAQRNFVQTLTKTFAQLPIGLALFDRKRQLALFNPALIDLTSLPADFLSSRPNLLTFFDRLRENRIMPEPKSYASWREHIAELVIAASDDRYSDTWTLPSGVTYRVIGRPHPDGAIALLFEDITSEVSLSRRFRAELELGQSILDALESPVAVFSQSGEMTFCNASYQALWRFKSKPGINNETLNQALTLWESQCKSSTVFTEIHNRLRTRSEQGTLHFSLRLISGEALKLTVSTVHGGSALVQFTKVETHSPEPEKLQKVFV